MLHDLIALWFGWILTGGYGAIFLLMAMESTVIPVPSELVMPPAAYWAAQGQLSFWGVVAAGTFGSYFGSAISYWFFRWVGAPFLHRYSSQLFLTEQKIADAEQWVKNYGLGGVFLSRLLPVVRHLISIPAGVLKMNFLQFSAVTLLGAGIWCWILSVWGQKVIGAHPDLLESPEKMVRVVRSEFMGFILVIVGFAGLYLLMTRLKRSSPSP